MDYVAIIEHDPGSSLGVWFPDVEGCFSAGDTLAEARENAGAALQQHIAAMGAAGQPTPPARPLAVAVRDERVRAALADGAALIVVQIS